MFDADEEDATEESPRQIARRQKREAGNRSAKAARALMEMVDADLAKLELSEDVRSAAEQARSTKSKVARRRHERHLAGVLRSADLADVEKQLQILAQGGRADARIFQRAEAWRTRLIEEGQPAIEEMRAELVGMEMERWQELVEKAQKERMSGSGKNAAKTLFRAIMTVLQAEEI